MATMSILSGYVALLSFLCSATALPTQDIGTRTLPRNTHSKRGIFIVSNGNDGGLTLGLSIGASILGLIIVIWIRTVVRRKQIARQQAIFASQELHPQPGMEVAMSQMPAPPYNPSNTFNNDNNTVPNSIHGATTTTTPTTHNVDAAKGITTTQVHMVDVPLNDHTQPQTQYPQPQMYQQHPEQTQQEFVPGHINTVREMPEAYDGRTTVPPPAASRH